MTTTVLEPYQERAIQELHDLENRCSRLHHFLKAPPEGSDPKELVFMQQQLNAMNHYAFALRARIQLWSR